MRTLRYRHAESGFDLSHLAGAIRVMLIAVIALAFAIPQPAVQAQEPPQYELTWFNNIWGPGWDVTARDMNESGVVVGYADLSSSSSGDDHRAFMWTEDTGTLDLNNLGGEWNDLGGTETADGWIAYNAQGINANGQIVGRATHPVYEDRAYVLSFPAGSPPQFDLLARSGGGPITGGSINDVGVVIADGGNLGGIVYTPWSNYQPVELSLNFPTISGINNSGLIVAGSTLAEPWIIHPDGTYDYDNTLSPPQSFPSHYWLRSLNSHGMIGGSRQSVGKGRNQVPGGAIRIDELGNVLLLAEGGAGTWADGINDAGDVCYTVDGTGYVFTDSTGSFGLLDRVVNPHDNWSSSWPTGINNAGQICGFAGGTDNWRSFLLTPVTPGPTKTYSSGPLGISIPDNSPTGISSTINVPDDFQIVNLTISLDIDHQRPSDLNVVLIGPDNTEVPLFNYAGNNDVPNFDTTSSLGLWKIKVKDTMKKKTGTLNSWSITVGY